MQTSDLPLIATGSWAERRHATPAAPPIALRRAFTLVELLVVMAIILIIAGLTLPALKGTFNGVNLSGASDVVISQLLFARQAAITRSTSVEVRIYRYDSGGGENWNTIALVIPTFVSGRTVDEWLDVPRSLAGDIIFDDAMSSTISFSTLIKQATTTPPTDLVPSPTAPWKTTESNTAPRFLKNLTYVAFRYLPDGSTNLLPTDTWCLSMRSANIRKVGTPTVPAVNFVTVILDPLTGRTSVFRP